MKCPVCGGRTLATFADTGGGTPCSVECVNAEITAVLESADYSHIDPELNKLLEQETRDIREEVRSLAEGHVTRAQRRALRAFINDRFSETLANLSDRDRSADAAKPVGEAGGVRPEGQEPGPEGGSPGMKTPIGFIILILYIMGWVMIVALI